MISRALLLALDNICHAIDEGSSMVLISLALGAALVTTLLLGRLQTSFGISCLVPLYPERRSRFVRIGCSTSPVTLCTTDFPQGSVLGPMLFSPFISPIAHILSSYGLLQQHYADHTQLSVATSKDNFDTPVAEIEVCLSNLHTWFCYNWLEVNLDKIEAIVFRTTQRSRSLPITSTVNVAETFVQVFNEVRFLVVALDGRHSFDGDSSLHF